MTHTPTRRLLALLLAVATVFSLLSMSVSAADEQTGPELKLVSTATEPLKKGDSFTVEVQFPTDIEFSNFELNFDFDLTQFKLTVVNTSYTRIVDGEEFEVNYVKNSGAVINMNPVVDEDNGKKYGGRIVEYILDPTKGINVKADKGILFTLTFEVLKCNADLQSISVYNRLFKKSLTAETFEDIAPVITPAQITISHTLTAVPAKDATCTEDGNTAYWTCSACEKWFSDADGTNEITDKESVVTKATGHTPSTTWSYDGNYHWHVCTTCNAVVDKTAHSGGAPTCSKQAACEVCGQKYGATTAHDYQWQSNATQHWKECSACKTVDPDHPATAHNFGEWVTEKEASCTETGTQKHTCVDCGYSETAEIAMLAHTLTHHEAVAPTCTTTGSIEYWECSVCGKKFSDEACTTEVTDVTQDKLPHDLTKTDAKAATCTAAGNEEYWVCSACGTWFSDESGEHEITDHNSVVIPATGHTANETGWYGDDTDHWHVCTTCDAVLDKTAHSGGTATCQAKAICNVCKAEYGEKADHTFVSKHDDTQHWKECSVCGTIDPDNLKTNHTFGEWETVTDSTCTVTGTKKHTCTGCDYSETGVIEKKNHTLDHHDRVEPTCTTTGSIEYWQCSDCMQKFSDAACTTEVTDVTLTKLPHSAGTAWEKDTTYHWHLCVNCGSEVMDKAAHTYGDWVTVTEATETEAGLRKRTCSVCGYEQTEEISMLHFTVTVHNGSGSGEYKSGETVTITADRRSGYTFEKWTVDSGNVTLAKETDSTTTFTMPAENVTVTATYRYNGGSGSGSSSGIVIKDENGKVLGKADPDTGIVELPITPVPAVSSSRQAEELEITIPKNTTVKVEIPVRNVTPGTVVVIVHADGTEEIVRTSVVTKKGVALELTGSATVKVYDNSKFFTDVPAANWASDAVAFASSRELFNGTGANTFSPNAPMTRQMLMTVLARLDGTDTSGNAYAKGMEWAIRNGVSNGSDPEGKITREQLATMLWRYAGNPSVSGRMTGFVDADQISGYAEDAMLWATKAGIIGGKGNGQLDPKGYATRAEVAAMLMRYCNTLFTK